MNLPLALISPAQVSLFWYLARGSGFVLFGLVTIGVCLGLLLSLHWRSDAWPRVVLEEIHAYSMRLAAVFLGLHVMSILLDGFIHFGLVQVLVPFAANTRRLGVGLGVLSLYAGVLVYGTTWLKKRIGYSLWRRLHYVGFVAWGLALGHGLLTGSDTHTAWGTGLYGTGAALVGGLVLVRVLTSQGSKHPAGQRVSTRASAPEIDSQPAPVDVTG